MKLIPGKNPQPYYQIIFFAKAGSCTGTRMQLYFTMTKKLEKIFEFFSSTKKLGYRYLIFTYGATVRYGTKVTDPEPAFMVIINSSSNNFFY